MLHQYLNTVIEICDTLINRLHVEKLTVHTRDRAISVGNKNPDSILRNILPGIANVCKLCTTVKEELA